MQLRRNGLRDERRRRVMMEDRTEGDSGKSSSDSSEDLAAHKVRSYSLDSLNEKRIRVTDFIPLRTRPVIGVYLIAITIVASLLFLHDGASRFLPFADLSSASSLGSWFASMTLFGCAFLSVMIYRIRRHRLDDYRGRYRVWIGVPVLLALLSLDIVADFRSAISQAIVNSGQQQFANHADGWWIVIWAAVLGLTGIRLAFEIRHSKAALALQVISGVCLATFAVAQLDKITWPAQVVPELAQYGALLAGLGCFALSMVHYARYVWLDAQGFIVVPEVKLLEVEDEVQDDEELIEEKPVAKRKPRKRAAAKKLKIHEGPEEEELLEEEEVEELAAKKSWFGWGKSKAIEEETEEEVEEIVVKKTKPAKKRKAVVKEEIEEQDEEVAPKKGWFGWGSNQEAEAVDEEEETDIQEEEVVERQNTLKLKLAEAAAKRAEKAAAEAKPKKKTTTAPRKLAHPNPPTLKMPQSKSKSNADDGMLEEFERLSAKDDHLMSKAERRRLKKLRRRVGKAA